jgi:acetyl esterase/lipase
MSLDPRVKRFLAILAAGNPPNALDTTVAQRRQALADLMRLGGAEVPIGLTEDRVIPGATGALPVRIYTPCDASATLLPGLLYLHGGGLVAGSIATHDRIARALANAGGCRVVSLGYRLAPEHRFPAALDDTLAAIFYLVANAADFGIERSRLGICGDSAGATLSAAACHALARMGGPLLALQLLLCPILDYSRMTESRRELASGYLVDQATLDHDLKYYLPSGADPTDPRISPLRAEDLSGLPPTIIHIAEFDPLRDEGRDYGERLRAAAVPVSTICHPGMIHLFYGLGQVIPYARTAYAEIGAGIRGALA